MKTITEMAAQVYGECVWHESALNHLEAFAALVRAEEREACAQLCDDWPNGRDDVYEIGKTIRARGNT